MAFHEDFIFSTRIHDSPILVCDTTTITLIGMTSNVARYFISGSADKNNISPEKGMDYACCLHHCHFIFCIVFIEYCVISFVVCTLFVQNMILFIYLFMVNIEKNKKIINHRLHARLIIINSYDALHLARVLTKSCC
jgi:hypothetical protein